jgi:hypothetical protein
MRKEEMSTEFWWENSFDFYHFEGRGYERLLLQLILKKIHCKDVDGTYSET